MLVNDLLPSGLRILSFTTHVRMPVHRVARDSIHSTAFLLHEDVVPGWAARPQRLHSAARRSLVGQNHILELASLLASSDKCVGIPTT